MNSLTVRPSIASVVGQITHIELQDVDNINTKLKIPHSHKGTTINGNGLNTRHESAVNYAEMDIVLHTDQAIQLLDSNRSTVRELS